MSYLQTPFLQALGYAIANSLWQIALLWLIVILVNSMAKSSSHIKYVTALSAQVAGFAWFVTTLQFYYHHSVAASAEAQQALLQNGTVYAQNFLTGNNSLLSFFVRAEETLPYLSIAYLMLLLLLVIKWIRNFRYTKQLATVGLQTVDTKWQLFINEMADHLNIPQDVKIYLSSLAKSPLTIGHIKPIILLPVASINHLSTEQLEAVLLHELAHIKRADYIINILVCLTEIILFFNPFTRLLSKLIQKERENCCDDWVLHHQYNAGMYAEALLRMAYLQKEAGFQMNAASHKKGELLQRVKRMVQPQKTFSYKHQMAALLLLTGLLFSIAWLQPDGNRFVQKNNSGTKLPNRQMVIAPLSAQIENPFFNAASLLAPSLQEEVNKSIAELDKTMHDSAVKKNLQQAQKALAQAAPEVASTLSSINLQKIINEAKREAKKSLQSVDWSALQQSVPHMPDSSLILQSLNQALFAKEDALHGAQQNLDKARQQLSDLQLKKLINLNFDKHYLQQITGNALDAVKNLNWNAIHDSMITGFATAQKAFAEQKKWQQQSGEKQKEWMKKIKENKRKTEDVLLRNKRFLNVPLPPLPPAAHETPPIGYEPVSGADDFAFSEPVFRLINNISKPSKTIRIIRNSDSSAINIVIEIRQ